MRIRIEFNDEEEHEAKMTIHGIDYYCALFEFSNFLRKRIKDEEQVMVSGELINVRDNFYEILNGYNISLED